MVVAIPVGVLLIFLLVAGVIAVVVLTRNSDHPNGRAPTLEEADAKAWALAQHEIRAARARLQQDPSRENLRAVQVAVGKLSGGPAAEVPPPPEVADRTGDPIDLIGRLAELRDRGIVSEEEFAEKKAALLARLG